MKLPVCLFGLALGAMAAEFPQTDISNGLIRAKLYLPDAERGYYRATRFDWSGVIASLEYKGHNYFGQWFERHDPLIHDAITGPVESFDALGYDQAKPEDAFVRIGVGAVRKRKEAQLNDANMYEIVDPGKWTIHAAPDAVEFVQELTDASGYAWVYRKTVRLAADKPQLILDHSLKNTGRRLIQASVYQHNFFVIDGQPAGPDFVTRFTFPARATRDLGGLAELRGGELRYLRELEKGQSIYTDLEGFGESAADYDFRVENRKTGAGVRQRSDRPISKLVFWSIRTTVCPEAFIHLRVEPGGESSWRIWYEFYSLQAAP